MQINPNSNIVFQQNFDVISKLDDNEIESLSIYFRKFAYTNLINDTKFLKILDVLQLYSVVDPNDNHVQYILMNSRNELVKEMFIIFLENNGFTNESLNKIIDESIQNNNLFYLQTINNYLHGEIGLNSFRLLQDAIYKWECNEITLRYLITMAMWENVTYYENIYLMKLINKCYKYPYYSYLRNVLTIFSEVIGINKFIDEQRVYTLLTYFIYRNDHDMILRCLKSKPDLHLKNSMNEDALDIAKKVGDSSIINNLQLQY